MTPAKSPGIHNTLRPSAAKNTRSLGTLAECSRMAVLDRDTDGSAFSPRMATRSTISGSVCGNRKLSHRLVES